MFAMNQTVLLYRYEGQSSARPLYAQKAEELRARVEPEDERTASGQGLEHRSDVRIFVPPGTVPGTNDRLVFGGRNLTVNRVECFYSLSGALHHAEIHASYDGR